jgi:hypothetical protein
MVPELECYPRATEPQIHAALSISISKLEGGKHLANRDHINVMPLRSRELLLGYAPYHWSM